MRIVLFEFPEDSPKIRNLKSIPLRHSWWFWLFATIFLSASGMLLWKTFGDPSSRITWPPVDDQTWGTLAFCAVWVGVVIYIFVFSQSNALFDQSGLSMRRLGIFDQRIPMSEIERVDLSFSGLNNHVLSFRRVNGMSAISLYAGLIRSSDLRDLCRAAGLKAN